MSTMEELEARVAALEAGSGRSGPLSGFEAWRAFFTGRAKYDGTGIQLIGRPSFVDDPGGSILWLDEFESLPVERELAVEAAILHYYANNFYLSTGASLSELVPIPTSSSNYAGLNAFSGSGAASLSITAQYGTPTTAVAQIEVRTDGDKAMVTATGALHFASPLSAGLTGNTNDYAPTGLKTATRVELTATGAVDLTGIVAPADDGRVLLVSNVGANTITLKDEDANSDAANRFALKADIALAADGGCILIYSTASSRWRCVGVY